jgi:hypothetical protein
MRTIYINSGQKTKKNEGSNWKIYMFLILFLGIIGSVIKLTAPTLVEKWINQKGASAKGYAFSIREVSLSLAKGQMNLMDVKIYNPITNTKMLEAPNLTIQLNLSDLLMSQEKKVSVLADKVDLILSKDLSSEMERIKTGNEKQKNDFYLNNLDAKIGNLNIIEQKEDQSRTVLELNDVNVKIKEVSLLSINKKTEFSITSSIADGGKLNLTGKTSEENGSTPWTIQGSLKQIPADTFNKIAGDKLPFSFNESKLNAEINAHSDHGKVSGEISPDIKRLNLVEEKPGIPTQTIARALTDELTFVLPFTLKDELTLQYADTYRKLKTYRKLTVSNEIPRFQQTPMSQAPKAKKSYSFWPF